MSYTVTDFSKQQNIQQIKFHKVNDLDNTVMESFSTFLDANTYMKKTDFLG
ncbi:hypothetical protein [Bacillus thuringiensis]|uniref:Uncharacterized protein n=1 Tax=Bacillus thuringiensis TaxID=1428 RepID=A0A1B2RCP8_BACTU|nr:hypothetical protein [Bacillus thuringiensis]AOB42304.1 hypothetical protein pFR260_207c [Bacillus thuringiensis]